MNASQSLRTGGALLVALIVLLSACGKKQQNIYSAEGVADYSDEPRTDADIQAAYDAWFEEPELPDGADVKHARTSDRIPVNNLGNLAELFNDSNKYQYAFAEKLGITPIESLQDAFYTSRPLVEIGTNKFFVVDSLTHSVPYLVPEAAILLRDIGRNFIDSLARRGGDGYRIIVTSVLRTPQSVKSLRKVNRNATDSSTHKFGTTFDITYSRFACSDASRPIHDGDLKNLLAEVLNDLRNQKRCMVKFEKKSPCFHITVTR